MKRLLPWMGLLAALGFSSYFAYFASHAFSWHSVSVLLQGAFAGGGRAVQQALLGARQWPAQGQGALLGAVAGGLNIRLGGPRFYDGHKLRYVTLGGCQEPDLSTPVRVLGRLRWLSLVWWLLSALFCGLYLYVHWPR